MSLIVLISGFTSQAGNNKNLVTQISFSQTSWSSGEEMHYYNITIPENAKSVEIEYQGIAPQFTDTVMGQNLTQYSGLFVYAFNTAPTEGQDPPTLWKNQVDSKTVNTPNTEA